MQGKLGLRGVPCLQCADFQAALLLIKRMLLDAKPWGRGGGGWVFWRDTEQPDPAQVHLIIN